MAALSLCAVQVLGFIDLEPTSEHDYWGGMLLILCSLHKYMRCIIIWALCIAMGHNLYNSLLFIDVTGQVLIF